MKSIDSIGIGVKNIEKGGLNVTLGVSRVINNIGFNFKKHSPEIFMVAGVVGVVASTVMACKASTKIGGIIKQTKGDVETIKDAMENGIVGQDYSEQDGKKDLTIVYTHAAVNVFKLYAPAVALGAISLTGIVASNQILRKRNMALAAAYATVDKGFKTYRNRVIERFGNEVDRQLRYNVKALEVQETVTDENGNTQTITKTKNVTSAHDFSGYERFFEQYTKDENGELVRNAYWEPNNEYNLMFLKAQQRYANDLLRSRKRLFLNEVYQMLGLPTTRAGQIVGWIFDESNPNIDNFVDFGIFNDSDIIYSEDDAILIDFNVDGDIFKNMKDIAL